MASILDKLKLGTGSTATKTSTTQFGTTPKVGGYLPMPTSFTAVNNVVNKNTQPTQTSTQITQPKAATTNSYVQPLETAQTSFRDASVELAGKLGRNPTGAEVNEYLASGTVPRNITNAPVSNVGVTSAGDQTNRDASIYAKLLKSQYGDLLSEDDYLYMANAALQKNATAQAEAQAAEEKRAAAAQKAIEAEQKRLADETERLRLGREADIYNYSQNLKTMAESDIARATDTYNQNLATSERLLGARQNLTSSVGVQNQQSLKQQEQDAISAINARVNAQTELYRAELEGADQATLDNIQNRINTLRDAENVALQNAEANLALLKQQAEASGDMAFLGLIQGAFDNLSVNKVASKYDDDATKRANDGYLYDEYGQRITDSEGNYMTYESTDELNGLMEISAGASLYDPTTGQFVATAPKDGQTTQKESAERVQMVRDAELNKRLVDELLSDPNLPRIVGAGVLNPLNLIPGSPAQETIAKFNQIIDKLTVDERGKLKGQGTITDYETRLLANAATPLKRGLGDEAAANALQNLSNRFQSVITADYLETKAGIDKETAYEIIDEYEAEIGVVPTVDVISKLYPPSFSQPAGTGSTTLRDGMRASTPFGTATLTGVEQGSSKWAYGLDLVIQGGKGAPVASPVSGTVISAQKDGGFGNSVKVQLADGRIVRMSHLDAFNVKSGQTIQKGQIVGAQGNTGDVYSLTGGDGTHLDVTIYDQNGKPYSSQQVAQLLGVTALA